MLNFRSNLRMVITGVSIWTILIGASLAWNISDQRDHIIELATTMAHENFNKFQAIRRWGSRHGGVYVPSDERTPPNPALAHLPNRDIVTRDGLELTLMNPAYMLRQIMNEYADLYGIKGKITGLVLLNPVNAPDDWEVSALHQFEAGANEVTEIAEIDGKSYLRFMRPMYMEQSCMKCHGHLGFKVGDIRGGVGVAIPLEKYIESGSKAIAVMWFGHGVIWILGCIVIFIIQRNVKHRNLEKQKSHKLEAEILHAEKANQAKSEFLSRMSHELRTPLNAILGFGQILEMDAEGFNETQRGNVKEIMHASHHLIGLINEVLDLSAIESGKLEVSMEDVILKDVVLQSIALIQTQAESRQIELTDHISDMGYLVKSDATRLIQVLVNLLSNAVKYSDKGGRIVLDCRLAGKRSVRIRVTDSGEGLSHEEIDKLFIPFERLNALNNVEGAGIGLVITKHLVELMGGTIGVESTPGQGCVFWVEIALSTRVANGKVK